ncbi:MAG: DUF3127 domain-containing protein [Bacteroidales bacterium]|nr:DUF3127 domain-containing protein [Bacteroidales bacterium]
MEIKGRIIQLLPLVTGESAKGAWKKQEYILETEAQYPKKICFNAWGDKVDQFNIQQGEELIVSVDLESREFNGRWYTDVRAWKVERAQAAAPAQNYQSQPGAPVPPPVEFFNPQNDGNNSTDDLPF